MKNEKKSIADGNQEQKKKPEERECGGKREDKNDNKGENRRKERLCQRSALQQASRRVGRVWVWNESVSKCLCVVG